MHSPAVAGDCTCYNKPWLKSDGRYNIELLKDFDKDWYNAIMGGIVWEILSCDMDKKKPEAAHIIALALIRTERWW